MTGPLKLLAEILLPDDCAGCGLPGQSVCAGCLSSLRAPRAPLCSGCGHPWPHALVDRCAGCLGPSLGARHAVSYEDPVPAVVTAFKDGGRRALAEELARWVVAAVPRPGPGYALVPVPTAPVRRRRRGYDHAELLARALGRAWDLPVRSALARVGGEAPQRGAARTERVRQVVGAFVPRGAPPALAVLVDDVHTTGATLAACGRTLRAAGCREVTAVSVARVWRS